MNLVAFNKITLTTFNLIHFKPVKLGVHRTSGIEDIALSLCHETACNHVIRESCNFVYGIPVP